MNTFGIYLLQMTCWLAAFWLVYTLWLKKETFFILNRSFLVTGLLISVLAPLIPVSYKVYQVIETTTATVATTATTVSAIADTTSEKTINYWLIAYLSGCILTITRYIIQQFSLFRLRRKSNATNINSIKVFKLEKETVPFSFFNHIYVSSKLSDETELNTIIAHEKVHITERHWIDLLLLEMVRSLQWFNPLLFLYRKAIMQNHEFLADSGTIRFGVSARTYKAVLVNQMLNKHIVNFANSFASRNSTKRLLMMKKDKSTPVKRIKFLLILPLIAIIVAGFAQPKYIYTEALADNQTANDSYDKNLREKSEGKAESVTSINGNVNDESGLPLQGAEITIISVNGQLKDRATSDENGNFVLKNISLDDIVVVAHSGYKSFKTIVQNQETLNILLSALPEIKDTIVPDKSEIPYTDVPLILVDDKIYEKPKETINNDSIAQIHVAMDTIFFRDEKLVRGKIISFKTKAANPALLKNGKKTVNTSPSNSNEVFYIVEEMPKFQGGDLNTFSNWVQSNLVYPEIAVESSISGRVFIQFTVNTKGQVDDVKVARGVDPIVDAEVIRVIKSSPLWKPGKQRGQEVCVQFTIPVTFKPD